VRIGVAADGIQPALRVLSAAFGDINDISGKLCVPCACGISMRSASLALARRCQTAATRHRGKPSAGGFKMAPSIVRRWRRRRCVLNLLL